jgi:hypothetical protein
MVGAQGLNGKYFLKCDLCGDELTCSNPSQTADNHLGGKDGKVGGCSVLKKEAKKRAADE